MVAHQSGSNHITFYRNATMATDIRHKECSCCKQTLDIELFGVCPAYKDGRRGQCNQCRSKRQSAYAKAHPQKRAKQDASVTRKHKLKVKYGLTLERYASICKMQNGVCAICGNGPDTKWRTLVVDHCHDTGIVRGLLCHRCNVALGRTGDNLDGLMRFVNYLRNQPATSI